jgi:chemosensory pili system protein ChpA (sensor histidine kinase/response regulator)
MITSRTGDKHRERARQIGIDHYLGKPYQEHELLETINRLVGLPGEALAAG